MSTPSIALVPLNRRDLPSADTVAALCGKLSEDTPQVTSRTDAAFTLSWDDGATANVTLVDRPIPWERLEGPCVTAWYWPDAADALKPHTDHLFITLIDEGRQRIDVAFRLTHLTVAVASSSPAAGIVWGASGAVHKPADFATLAGQSSLNDLPLHLWIDFRAYEADGGGFGLFTTGMEALGRRELEVVNYTGDPQHLVGAVYNIAHYVLEKDAMLKDSEVIGLPDESQVTIREAQSSVDPEQEVFRLEFE
ncbi:hypothetical protein MalM25_27070 [Planctomycetes bacterium MalM25]|nr:hypothetical protein MalM25_27070 [Planctomycetes bacterium MalM25]